MPKRDFPPLFPAGIHPKTLAEVEAAAVQRFPGNARRELIWQQFSMLYATVTSIVPRCEWWIDGSFLTAKDDPDDIDAAVFIEANVFNNLSAHSQAILEALRDRPSTKLNYLTDFFIVPAEDVNQRFYWRGVFGFGHDSISAKGFVSVRHG